MVQGITACDAVAPSIVDNLLVDCTEDFKTAFAGINFSGMLAKMFEPSFLQYLHNPTWEGWAKLDPALMEVGLIRPILGHFWLTRGPAAI